MNAVAGLARRALVLVLVLAVGALAAPALAATPASPTTWGPATPWEDDALIAHIDCPSADTCVAIGFSGRPWFGFVVVQTDGTWGERLAIPLPADAPDEFAQSYGLSIDCGTDTSCLAVGAYEASTGTAAFTAPVTLTGSGGVVGAATRFEAPADASPDIISASLTDVSCQGAQCTVVGYYLDSARDGAAMAGVASAGIGNRVEPPAGAPGDALLTAVSCAATGPCQAVGKYLDGTGSWTTTLTAGSPTGTVPVPMPADSIPSDLDEVDEYGITRVGLGEISCPSSDVCTAVGGYASESGVHAIAVPVLGGDPQTAVVMEVAGDEPMSTLSGVSCSSGQECTVVGHTGSTANLGESPVVGGLHDGTWDEMHTLPAGPLEAGPLFALDCVAPSLCTAGGTAEGSSGYFADAAPTLTTSTASLPDATVGQPYSATLTSTGGSGEPLTWALASGSLPAGLTLDAATGVVSGTPTAAGSGSFSATVSDAGLPEQSATTPTLALTVKPAPVVPPVTPPPVTPPVVTPPVVTPPVITPTSPVATVSITKVGTRWARVRVKLACDGAPCSGRVTLTRVSRDERKRRTLATSPYDTWADTSSIVRLVLGPKAAARLERLGTLRARVDVRPTGQDTPAATERIRMRWAIHRG